MEADTRAFPNPELESEQTEKTTLPVEPKVEEIKEEPQVEPKIVPEPEVDWKKKAIELEAQKNHWKNKYDRDINNPAPVVNDEYLSDEGRMLGEKIKKLEDIVLENKRKEEERTVLEKYPQLKDKQDEFNEYLESPENSGISFDRLAKIFVLEKGLVETQPKRKGLEKPTGGSSPKNQSSGMSADDLKRLRENEPRKYEKLIREGRIDLDNIN